MDKMDLEVLVKEYKTTGNESLRDSIIIEGCKTVKIIAHQIYVQNTNPILSVEDYESYGIFGLIDALNKYTLALNTKFVTYASIRIRGAILDELRKLDPLKRTGIEKKQNYAKYIQEAIKKYGPTYTRKELIEVSGLDVKEFNSLELFVSTCVLTSLDKLMNTANPNHDEMAFDVKDEVTSWKAEKTVLEQELAQQLRDSMKNLTEKEQLVLQLSYYEECTLNEIAKIMSVSESRVSQLRSKALVKMRKYMTDYCNL